MKSNQLKHAVFRHYLSFAAIGTLAIIAVLLLLRVELKWPECLALLGVPFTFVYSVQKQKLEETRLFKKLFDQFNERYNRLNEELNRIRASNPDQNLTAPEINTLYDYFNLCGEEHLYTKLDYIPPEVWKYWYNGMCFFLGDPRIWRLWKKEAQSDSYYGLEFHCPTLNKPGDGKDV